MCIDGVDSMRIGLGNSGKEMKIACCEGCGGVDDSAYSRVDSCNLGKTTSLLS